MTTHDILAAAKAAAPSLAGVSTERKNAALIAMADALIARKADILAANAEDVAENELNAAITLLDELTKIPEPSDEGEKERLKEIMEATYE